MELELSQTKIAGTTVLIVNQSRQDLP